MKNIKFLHVIAILYYIFFIGSIESNHCCKGPLDDNLKCSKVYYDNFVIEYHCINDTLLFIYNNDSNSPENYNDLPPLSLMNSTIIIPNLHNSIPICGKCDAKLTNSFIGIILFIAVLFIGILILILFYYNKDIKNCSQYLPIHSPGSNQSSSSSFLINNNTQNHNSNNNNIYNPYYNSTPYHLSPSSNNSSLNPSLISYHQTRLLGNTHSNININNINNINNNNNNKNIINSSNSNQYTNKNGEKKIIQKN
ncbi:hypothetical protein RB653_008610 [Dictyostelium firmibasis]|uniref:Uncharacterized protein n=1 Tax=Dictyostelium firmibasis TaxID=79012 RepID=A0AAN7U0L8_9MYCE